MPLFEFKLKPLAEVLLWDDNGKKYLSWFGLTDGIYHMSVKGHELFKYTKEYIDFLKITYPEADIESPYIDYQVIRLYEDFMDILPDVLQNIPLELVEYIKSLEAEKTFLNEFELKDYKNDDWEIYYDATRWWNCRSLTSGHLQNGRRIQFWSDNDIVHIRWDNSDLIENGIQMWESLTGEVQYDKKKYFGGSGFISR